jgi:hypothetical protein
MRGQIVEESRATIDDSDLVKGEQWTAKDYILRTPAPTVLAPPLTHQSRHAPWRAATGIDNSPGS